MTIPRCLKNTQKTWNLERKNKKLEKILTFLKSTIGNFSHLSTKTSLKMALTNGGYGLRSNGGAGIW
jgi:hypothetical protein